MRRSTRGDVNKDDESKKPIVSASIQSASYSIISDKNGYFEIEVTNKNETIIDIPFCRTIFTPAKRLEAEKEQAIGDENSKYTSARGLSRLHCDTERNSEDRF